MLYKVVQISSNVLSFYFFPFRCFGLVNVSSVTYAHFSNQRISGDIGAKAKPLYH
jgi:hypothetical protein